MSSRLVYSLALVLILLSVRAAPAAAPSERLVLKSGDTLDGTSESFDPGGDLKWRLPDGTVQLVPLADVERIELAPQSATDPPALPPTPPDVTSDADVAPLVPPAPESDDPAEPADESLFEETLLEWYEAVDTVYDDALQCAQEWTKRVEFGARFIDGNSNDDFIDIKGIFERSSEMQMYQYEFGGNYGKSDGETAANRWYGNATIDLSKKGNWIIFFSAKNIFDELANLNYRGTYSGGLGYRVYNESKKRLIIRIGPGMTYERFHDPSKERVTPDLFAETEIRWPFFCGSQLEHTTTIHPSVAAEDVFRLTSKSGFLFSLDDSDKWQLKLGFRYNFNSDPATNRRQNDYLTSVLVVYTRK